MDSDNESYHSEGEFYYPDEENVLKEDKTFRNTSNSREDEEMSTIQGFIEAQRPENTTKKTAYDINVWKRFCSSIGEARDISDFSWMRARTPDLSWISLIKNSTQKLLLKQSRRKK